MAWGNSEAESISVVNISGPIQDACMAEETWFITGWRQDLRWPVSQFHSEPDVGVRSEIGNKIVNRNEDGFWVLDNRGQWSAHMSQGNSS